MRLLRVLLAVFVIAMTGACTTTATDSSPSNASQPITIQTMECSDPLLGRMMTQCVKERLGERTRSETVMSDENRTGLVIRGAVYRKDIGTASSSSSGSLALAPSAGFGMAQSQGNAFTGNFVEGVSLVALLDGKEVESATFFQTPKKGTYKSPQWLIQVVTDKIYVKLVKRGLIVRR